MRNFLFIILLIGFLTTPAAALELEAPTVPDSGAGYMPDGNGSFGEGLFQLVQNVIKNIRPDIQEALSVCLSVTSVVVIISVIQTFDGTVKYVADYAGTIAVAAALFFSTNSMIQLGAQTISEISEYGKLLFPVMTAAMAAQGGLASSAAIYTGTTIFSAVLSALVSKLFLPMVYLFLALSSANSAIGDDLFKNLRDLLKQLISWSLKTLLTIFTTYISITGVVSGTTDAATLKATKVTISSFVPVVGSILSDASEAVLVSIGLAKNAAGIYGIFAILALFLEPFMRIGLHYLLLKTVCGICGILGPKRICDLIGDFSTAMGLLLAMTGTVCTLLLIATVCFMKGVG